MPKHYDAENAGKDDKISAERKPCATCAGTRTVRVSKGRLAPGKYARQLYDIVTERCPDC